MAVRNYSNTAVDTTLNGGITNVQTTCTLTADTGWPAVPFTMEIENEVVLVTARTGTSITTMTRGYDGTSNVSHSDGAPARHVVVAADFDLIGNHSAAHSDGGDDEIDVVDLGSGAQGASFVLETDGSGGLQWIATPTGWTSPLMAKGDLHGYDTDDARVPVGVDGRLLMADSGETLGVAWANDLTSSYRFSHASGITFGAAGDAQLSLFKFTDTYQIRIGNDSNVFTKRVAFNTSNHATQASDIIFYAGDGTTIILHWDEDADYWQINGAYLTDVTSISFGDLTTDRAEITQVGTDRIEFNWVEEGVSNRKWLSANGPTATVPGDILFESPDDGDDLLLWDESDDRWEFHKGVDFTGQTVTGLAHEITVRKNTGADVGTRSRLNFIEGSNVTLTVTDDSGNDEVDITIAASGGGTAGFAHSLMLGGM